MDAKSGDVLDLRTLGFASVDEFDEACGVAGVLDSIMAASVVREYQQ